MVDARTIISAARTGVYGTLAALCIRDPHTRQVLDAAILGCVLADFGSWLVYSLLALPAELCHGAYDGVINTLFGLFFFRTLQPGTVFDGEALAIGFAASLLMLTIKVIYYASDYLREATEDGM